MSSERAHRFAGLDGLRGAAAVAVVAMHMWMFEYGDAGKPEKQPLDLFMRELRLAVPLFFVLSGFLLVQPWLKAAADRTDPPDLKDYLRKRCARIVPAYWVAIVGSLCLVWSAGRSLLPPLDHFPLFVLFAQNYDVHSIGKIDPPMWTLDIEMSFYLVLPIIGWALVRGRTGPKVQIAICLLLVAAGALFNTWAELTDAPRTLTTSLLSQGPYFAIGMATAALCRIRKPPRLLWIAGLALVVADAAWHISTHSDIEYMVRDIPAGVGFALIVASPPQLMSFALFTFLGKLSYGIYLWHFPVIVWMRLNGLWPDRGLLLDTLIVLTPTMMIAALSWFLVERPAIAWSHRRDQTKRRARANASARVEISPEY